MAGFQNTLTGGSPTVQTIQKRTSTAGIDAVTGLVGMAGQVIGANYALGKADKAYENAFAQHTGQASSRANLDQSVKAKQLAYQNSNGDPKLLEQLVRLEDEVRKIDLGESSGSLSPLSAKSRIDGAYKQVLSRFPQYATEIKGQRDALAGGGAIGMALDAEELRKNQAKDHAEAIAKDMAKYGMDPNNEEARIRYQMLSRLKGEMEFQHDFWTASTATSRQKTSDEQKEQTLAYGKNAEVRSQENHARAKEAEKRAVEKFGHDKSKWPLEIKQQLATYQKTVEDTVRTQQTIEYNRRMQPYNLLNAENKQADYQKTQKANEFMNKYKDFGFASDWAQMGAIIRSGAPIEDTKKHVEQFRMVARQKLVQQLQANDMMGTRQGDDLLKNLDEDYDSMSNTMQGKDPLKVAENTNKAMKLIEENEWMKSDGYAKSKILKRPGMVTALNRYNSLRAEAVALQESGQTVAAKSKNTQASAFAQFSGLGEYLNHTEPNQVFRDIDRSFANGRPVNSGVAGVIARVATSPDGDANDPDTQTAIELASMDDRWGLASISNIELIKKSRQNPELKGNYGRAFTNHLDQTAALLPDNYGLRYNRDGWAIVKKGTPEAVVDLSKNFTGDAKARPSGGFRDGFTQSPGFQGLHNIKWPENFSSVQTEQLMNRMTMLSYSIKQAGDMLNPTYETYQNGGQNKNASGTIGDAAVAVGNFVSDELFEDAEAGHPTETRSAYVSPDGENRLPEVTSRNGETTHTSGEIRTGGSKAWRNNNPGNISGMNPDNVGTYGAAGVAVTTTGDSGDQRQLVFNTREEGVAAFDQLIERSYSEGAIEEELKTYQTSESGYRGKISSMKKAGIDVSKPVGDLTAEQYEKFREIMFRFEGWKEGKIKN